MNLFYKSKIFGDLFFDNIVLFYDEPQLFTLKNNVDSIFLCLLSHSEVEEGKWLLIPISGKRLKDLHYGFYDVKFCFEKAENNIYLISQDYEGNFYEEQIQFNDILDEYLPDEGLFVSDVINDKFIQEAVLDRRSILGLRIIDKTDSNSHELPVSVVASTMLVYDELKYAIARDNPKYSNIKPIFLKDYTKLNASAFMEGSFVICLKSNNLADATNENFVLTETLFDLNNLLSENLESFCELIKNKKHRTISKSRDFMRLVLNDKYDFEITVASPNKKISKVSIDKKNILDKYEVINKYILAEPTVLKVSGKLIKGDIEKRKFCILTEDGDRLSGNFHSEFRPSQILLNLDINRDFTIESINKINEDTDEIVSIYYLLSID